MKLLLIFAFLSVAVFAQEIISDPAVRCDPPSEEVIYCTLIYDPVCAFKDSDPAGTPGVTVGNSCEACQQQGYDWYTVGACEETGEGEVGEGENGEGGEGEGEFGEGEGEGEWTEGETGVTWCEIPDLSATDIVCTLQYDPVCAYNIGDVNGVTVGNACQACLQDGYDYYTQGECAGNGGTEEDNGVDIIPVEIVEDDNAVL